MWLDSFARGGIRWCEMIERQSGSRSKVEASKKGCCHGSRRFVRSTQSHSTGSAPGLGRLRSDHLRDRLRGPPGGSCQEGTRGEPHPREVPLVRVASPTTVPKGLSEAPGPGAALSSWPTAQLDDPLVQVVGDVQLAGFERPVLGECQLFAGPPSGTFRSRSRTTTARHGTASESDRVSD
jgi:hypothetical protein